MTEPLPSPDPTSKPRGLWSVMAQSAKAVRAETRDNNSIEAAPRSLFELMKPSETANPPVEEQSAKGEDDLCSRSPPDADTDRTSTVTDACTHPSLPVLGKLEAYPTTIPADEVDDRIFPFVDLPASAFPLRSRPAEQRNRQSRMAIGCGIVSIALSPLAMRPEVWLILPASASGFAAMVFGYLAIEGSRLQDLSTINKSRSAIGILTGLIGIFLGPFFFAGLRP